MIDWKERARLNGELYNNAQEEIKRLKEKINSLIDSRIDTAGDIGIDDNDFMKFMEEMRE